MKKLLLLSCLLILGCPKGGDLPPSPVNPGPSVEMQAAVSEIVPIQDKELAAFYGDFADIIERDSEIIQTTGHVRDAHMRAGQLMFQKTGMKGKYPGLAEKVDAILMQQLGAKNTALDRKKAVEVFRALSWAFE